MDIEKLEADYRDNKDVLAVLHEFQRIHGRALAVRQKLIDMEAARAAGEAELDLNPNAPGYAAAKAVHADKKNTLDRTLTKWGRLYKDPA